MGVYRAPQNPIFTPQDLTPSREGFEIVGVFNAGAIRYRDEIILLLRVAERPIASQAGQVLCPIWDVAGRRMETKLFRTDDPGIDFSDPRLIVRAHEAYLTSISHLRVARSQDGVTFVVEDAPALAPAEEYETFGIEDPRITHVNDTYYIAYVAVSPRGVVTALASTQDFRSFRRHGIIFAPENKDAAIFSGTVHGRYFALHRPCSPLFQRNEIWIAESPDLLCWGRHRHLAGLREDRWDETRIGAGAVPFRIDEGWLEIYHGADRNNRYCLGALLLDRDEPGTVIARSEEPVFTPETNYECSGFFANVVFTCGLLFERETLRLYYGAADTTVCYAEIPLTDVLATLRP